MVEDKYPEISKFSKSSSLYMISEEQELQSSRFWLQVNSVTYLFEEYLVTERLNGIIKNRNKSIFIIKFSRCKDIENSLDGFIF